jgi:hemolysin III
MHDNWLNLPPEIADDEWANTSSHMLGIAIAVGGTLWMFWLLRDKPLGLTLCCVAYCASAILVFVFSTLSHAFTEPSRRTRMRAWDQGSIYLMISGTYTPFVWQYGGSFRLALMIFIWTLALYGLWAKVVAKHRVNTVAFTTYLLLGWVPAIPLAPQVPLSCLGGMALGGILYSLGVIFLKYDHVWPFFHAVWHFAVIIAAACHYLVIVKYVVNVNMV